MPSSFPNFRQVMHDESGQDLVEYALLACVIGLGAVAALKSTASAVKSVFTSLSNVFAGAL